MDYCCHYVNIFETKGLEYILVIIFLSTLVLFMRHLVPQARNGNGRPHVVPWHHPSEAESGRLEIGNGQAKTATPGVTNGDTRKPPAGNDLRKT